jgi:hypothetical protein
VNRFNVTNDTRNRKETKWAPATKEAIEHVNMGHAVVLVIHAEACPCRKLNPTILMVQSTENWRRTNGSNELFGA